MTGAKRERLPVLNRDGAVGVEPECQVARRAAHAQIQRALQGQRDVAGIVRYRGPDLERVVFEQDGAFGRIYPESGPERRSEADFGFGVA